MIYFQLPILFGKFNILETGYEIIELVHTAKRRQLTMNP